MSKQTTDLLSRLKELHGMATPEPWACYTPSELPGAIRIARDVDLTGLDAETFRAYLGRVTCSHDPDMSGSAWGAHKMPNMPDVRLMVELRNAFPAILEYVSALEAESKACRAYYNGHTDDWRTATAAMAATDAARKAVRG